MSSPFTSRSGAVRRSTTLTGASPGIPNTTVHVTGIALTLVSLGMGIGAIVERASTNVDTTPMVVSTVLCAGLGLVLWRGTRVGSVRTRAVFAAVGWTWVIVTVVGAVPYVLAGTFATGGADLVEQIVNAIFESASGFSCTGSTALNDFDSPGRGLMLYRQATQWFGGMGFVVLAVTILPFLGVGGLDLIATEAPGDGDERRTPRVAETARRLCVIYVCFTVAVILALWFIPRLGLYDSVAHALTATSTGGFSPYRASIGHYDNVVVELVLMAAMVYGGANFALHWRSSRGELGAYARDPEFRGYVLLLAAATAAVFAILTADSPYSATTALRAGAFNVVSLVTSTGYGNATGAGTPGDFVEWAPAAQVVLLLLFVAGGSTGSAAGGIKILRVQVLFGHAVRSIRRTQQPRAVIPVKHGKRAVPEDVVSRMAGFFLLYVLLVIGGVLALTSLGGDLDASIGGVLSSLGNMGPALGEAGPTASYSTAFSQPARLVLALYMLVGRLEIFPILLMFAAPYRAANDRLRRGATR